MLCKFRANKMWANFNKKLFPFCVNYGENFGVSQNFDEIFKKL